MQAHVEKLIKICNKKNVAMQTIARGKLGDKKATHNVWYEPITDNSAIQNLDLTIIQISLSPILKKITIKFR